MRQQSQPVKSEFGAIRPLEGNPRKITPEAFRRLTESVSRDPQFMLLRPIVIDADGVVIGGNQRLKACQALGMTELPAGWVVRAGELTEEQRRRFILIDNAPDGASGSWDQDILKVEFDLNTLADCGFKLAEDIKINTPVEADLSEENPKLKAFIASREKSRKRGQDKGERNFWLCLVFQSFAQKVEFLRKFNGLETKYDMYVDGEDFAKRVGHPVTLNTQPPVNGVSDKKLTAMVLP